jgi:ribosome maturation factor RimP
MPGKSPIGNARRKFELTRFAEWAGGPLFVLLTSQSPEKKRLPTETNEIARIIEPSLEAMGYRLVRIAFVGARAATLQIMAERADEAAMTVEDCAEISRTVSALLDVADPIAGAYTLEISSPGIDRPLVRPEDYERFAGFEAKVELAQPLDGRKRFRGRLLGRTDRGARLLAETGEVLLPFDAIQRAKLVLSNELMAAAQRNSAKPDPTGPVLSSRTH